MAADPIFAATPAPGVVAVSTANTARDGTGTIATLKSAGSLGSLILWIISQWTVTSTAGMIRVFLHNGTSAFLFDEIPVAAATVSATVAAARTARQYQDLSFPSGWSARLSTHNGEASNGFSLSGDF
jgi:hypothetical protein